MSRSAVVVGVILEASVVDRDGGSPRRYVVQGSVLEVHQVLTIFLPLGLALTPSRAGERVVAALTRELWDRIDAGERIAGSGGTTDDARGSQRARKTRPA